MDNLLSRMKIQLGKQTNLKNKSKQTQIKRTSAPAKHVEAEVRTHEHPSESDRDIRGEEEREIFYQQEVKAEEEMLFDNSNPFSGDRVRDDELLGQIDEFRARAQKLQEFLQHREVKAMELQRIVDEREDRAEELQHILEERQEKADGITAEVAKQVNGLVRKVDAKLEEINDSFDAKIKENQQASELRAKQTEETLHKIHAQIEELGQNNSQVQEQFQDQLREQLDTVKSDLSEKIHSESVQSYRNTQELIRGLDEKISKVDVLEKNIHSLHVMSIVVIVLTALDLLGVVGAVVLSLNLI